jgi:glutamyl/glutaminyl-tRNA synthetase
MHIEKEAKKIEKLNHLYKLKINGELFEKSNIESVLIRLKTIAESINIKSQYLNNDELITAIVSLAKEKNITVIDEIKKEEKRPPAIKVNQGKVVEQRMILSTKKVYNSFMKQDRDLASFLIQKEIDKKQFLSIFIRTTLQYNKFLLISKEINIEHKGIKLPYITKRQ